MFQDRVKLVMDTIGASNNDIAEYAYCDASNISRLRSGARVPKQTSPTVIRFAEAIIKYADNHLKREQLEALLEVEEGVYKNNMLENEILLWLYQDETERNATAQAERESFISFGEKLTEAMMLTGTSSAKLSRAINVDASYISRLKNGLRRPKSNPNLIDLICQALLDSAKANGQLVQLCKLIEESENIAENDEMMFVAFRNWICDYNTKDNRAVKKLINSINSFSGTTAGNDLENITLVPYEKIKSMVKDDSPFYRGKDGIRDAVVRFLCTAIDSNAKEFYLYSDEEMGWMTADRDFTIIWISLMVECVSHGMKIKIIHNVDRDVDEMVDAIRYWLPVYMSKMVESFYLESVKGTRFSHVLFICPDIEIIQSFYYKGQKTEPVYYYSQNSEILDYFKLMFDDMLAESKPLVIADNKESGEETGRLVRNEMFGNIDVFVNKSSVVVRRTKEPFMTFTLYHPMLCKAFKYFYNDSDLSN